MCAGALGYDCEDAGTKATPLGLSTDASPSGAHQSLASQLLCTPGKLLCVFKDATLK